jgi:hypothetical protein
MTPEIDIYADNPEVNLDYIAAVTLAAKTHEIEAARYGEFPLKWANFSGWDWNKYIFRAKRPEPKLITVPMTNEDVAQLSLKHGAAVYYRRRGHTRVGLLSTMDVGYDDYEYSTDLVNWRPFTKQVPEEKP